MLSRTITLLWKRFTPLEERLLAEARTVLGPEAQAIFDAQVDAITLIQRHLTWTEICFYRKKRFKLSWAGVPEFPCKDELPIAEVRFKVGGKSYKCRLTAIGGHIFDLATTPGPKSIAFADWDSGPKVKLLNDPMVATAGADLRETIPEAWSRILARNSEREVAGWALFDESTAYRIPFDVGEFLILAEREGDEFILQRLEPISDRLYYLESHDGVPEPFDGDIETLIRRPKEE